MDGLTTPDIVAVIFVKPGATATTRPSGDTVATMGLELVQTNPRGLSTLYPPTNPPLGATDNAYVTIAVN